MMDEFQALALLSRILAELMAARGKLGVEQRLWVASVLKDGGMPTVAGVLVDNEGLPFDAEEGGAT